MLFRSGLSGTQRFLEKIWKLQNKISDKKTSDDKINNLLHKTIKKVGEDIENFRFNTAVSQMMILVNEMEKSEIIPKEIYKNFLIILSPFAPHIAEELWNQLGIKTSIFKEKWPEYDRKLIKDEEFQLVIQINGKVRDTVAASMDMAENEAKELAMQSEKVKKHLAGKEIKKVIFVKNRLINIVV